MVQRKQFTLSLLAELVNFYGGSMHGQHRRSLIQTRFQIDTLADPIKNWCWYAGIGWAC
jgi:hypothetical protein